MHLNVLYRGQTLSDGTKFVLHLRDSILDIYSGGF